MVYCNGSRNVRELDNALNLDNEINPICNFYLSVYKAHVLGDLAFTTVS